MEFADKGWMKIPLDARLLDWVQTVAPLAMAAAADPQLRAEWSRCDGSWFVGVDALPNDGEGRLDGGAPLRCKALDLAAELAGRAVKPLHRGQVSVLYPGYPRHGAEESTAAFRYRCRRDAAHLDGLLAVGPERRRKMLEYHGFILGLPVTYASGGAAPLVVWEGSVAFIRAMLERAFDGVDPANWADVDLTQTYQATRREIFAQCKRVEVAALPGEALLLHRHMLHGMAPWQDGAIVDDKGRAIVYFRPEYIGGIRDWVEAP